LQKRFPTIEIHLTTTALCCKSIEEKIKEKKAVCVQENETMSQLLAVEY
jgi:hypothetical protein